MWPALALGGFDISFFGIGLAVGLFLFSFFIWKQGRTDYPEDEILSLTIVLVILGLIGFSLWRWTSVGGLLLLLLLGLNLWARKNKWDFWEWLDMLGPLSLKWGILACLSWGLDMIVAAGALFIGVVLVALVKRFYRRFAWYKSGKVGFVGITSVIGWLVAWILIANWQTSNVYWGGLRLEQWIAIWAIIALATVLYLRGGRKTSQDLKIFSKLWPQKAKKLR